MFCEKEDTKLGKGKKDKKCKDCGHSKCKCPSKQVQKVDQNVEVKINLPRNEDIRSKRTARDQGSQGDQGPQGNQGLKGTKDHKGLKD